MRQSTRLSLFLLLVFLYGCSCGCGGGQRSGHLRIGIDSSWYPIDFGPQQVYVNGFIGDLLLEVAHYNGIEFERIDANWDTLFEEKNFDAILTSLPAYSSNEAKYDFSQNFLDLGPVLIVPVNARHTELSHMKGELVGLVEGDPASLVLQKYPEVILRSYQSIPSLLNALAGGEIEGALLNQIPAASYVADLFDGRLKIASPPMTDAGLHLVAPKAKGEKLVRAFDKSIAHLKKKKKLQALLKKWNLGA